MWNKGQLYAKLSSVVGRGFLSPALQSVIAPFYFPLLRLIKTQTNSQAKLWLTDFHKQTICLRGGRASFPWREANPLNKYASGTCFIHERIRRWLELMIPISHISKVMFKTLQTSLQYVNQELPDVQCGFKKAKETEIKMQTSGVS